MPLYESTFIARHDMSAQQVESLAENLTTIIKENGGEVAKTEFWGPRTLAYRIKKNRKGHYIFFNLDAPSDAVQEFERNMRLNEDVLRYLTVRVEELDPNPSAIMQSRSARDDRSRRSGPPRGRDESAPRDKDAAKDKAKPAADAEAETKDKAKPAADAEADAEAADDGATESPSPTTTKDAAAEEADAKPTKAKSKAAGAKKAKPKSKAKRSDEDAAGSVRIGLGRFTTEAEIDKAIDRIAAAVERLRGGSTRAAE